MLRSRGWIAPSFGEQIVNLLQGGAVLCFGCILACWALTLIGIGIGAPRLRSGSVRFPSPLSSLWLPILLAEAYLPLNIQDAIANTPKWNARFVPYAFAVTVPLSLLAGVSFLVQLGRAFHAAIEACAFGGAGPEYYFKGDANWVGELGSGLGAKHP